VQAVLGHFKGIFCPPVGFYGCTATCTLFLFSADFFKKLDDEGNGTVQARLLFNGAVSRSIPPTPFCRLKRLK
jgi:hypothetical protein